MNLCIYEAYAKRRKAWQDLPKINLTERESHVQEHKARIVLDMICKYIQKDGKDIIDIAGIKLIDFSFWIQEKTGREEV